jgi:hypothetical protein
MKKSWRRRGWSDTLEIFAHSTTVLQVEADRGKVEAVRLVRRRETQERKEIRFAEGSERKNVRYSAARTKCNCRSNGFPWTSAPVHLPEILGGLTSTGVGPRDTNSKRARVSIAPPFCHSTVLSYDKEIIYALATISRIW